MDYEKFRKVRDEVSREDDINSYAARADVLAQIAAAAFANEDEPDNLPNPFVIKQCGLNSAELINIFNELEINPKRISFEDIESEKSCSVVVFLK